MPTDPNATQDPAPDPIEDTQADGSQDTAPDTQGSTVDWETRYKELQKRATKAERERDLLRQQATPAPDEDEEEPEDEAEPAPTAKASPAANSRVQRDLWNLAEQLYGSDAVEAYGHAQRLVSRAETPADYIAAFEAYHERRLAGATPKAAAAPAQGEQAPQRRIESNRPDASPDLTELDRQAEAAAAKGDLRGVLAARIEKTLRR